MDITNEESFFLTSNKTKEILINNLNKFNIYNKPKNFNIFCMNIRSIGKNFDNLYTEIITYKLNLDIIILTEIWGDNIKEKIKQISGFKQITYSKLLNQSGGVALYYKNDINFTLLNDKIDTADSIIGTFKLKDKLFTIVAIYRSQSLKNIKKFNDDLINS